MAERKGRKRPNGTSAYGVAFGARLRGLREAAGLTPSQLGEAAGLPYRRVWEYENGRRAPSLEVAGLLAGVLGGSLAVFDGLAEKSEESS